MALHHGHSAQVPVLLQSPVYQPSVEQEGSGERTKLLLWVCELWGVLLISMGILQLGKNPKRIRSAAATPGAFVRDPSLVWEFYHWRREVRPHV